MAVVTMKALLESGVHFGHRTHKWHPHMKPYIFTERNGIHIVNLQITVKALEDAYKLVRDTVAEGGNVLFVGTKRQAQETIEKEAVRCGMPYVTERWLGGFLTNWRTIRERINELERLERMRDKGDFELLTKKEGLMLTRKIEKLETRLSGIRNMVSLPELLFAVDVRREETAIHEANLLEIPVIAMVDTNCDPRDVDYIIPSNDDAIRAIKLIVGKIADAVMEGKAMRKEEEEIEFVPTPTEEEEELADEDLLGAATLAKLRSSEEEREEEAVEQEEEAEAEVEDDEGDEKEEVEDEEEGDEALEQEEEAEVEEEEAEAEVEDDEGDEEEEVEDEEEGDEAVEQDEEAEVEEEEAEAEDDVGDEEEEVEDEEEGDEAVEQGEEAEAEEDEAEADTEDNEEDEEKD